MITEYTRNQAKKFGVVVKISKNPLKKLDVFKNGVKIASIGAKGYKDYGMYLVEKGEKYANERRRLYRIRHSSDLSKGRDTAAFLSLNLLW
jgi:hypothetical protein